MTKPLIYTIILIGVFLSSCKKSGKDVIASYYQQGKLNGAVFLAQNDSIICDTVLGYSDFANKIPFQKHTPFFIASLTKPITAIGIMILQQKGSLNYEDKASKYIENLPMYAQDITINEILTHTSGIKDYDERIDPKRITITNDEVINWLHQQSSLNFTPGSRFEYSNSGYILLSKIIERASCKTYKEFLQENIFDPLKMEHTIVFDETKPLVLNKAIGFDKDKKLDDYIQITTGDVGIYSTTEDLYKVDKALRNGNLLSKQNAELMYQAPLLNDGNRSAYGFGWFVSEDGSNIVRHEGDLYGFRTLFWRDLKNNITLIVLTNQGDAFPVSRFLKDMKKTMP